MKNINKKTVAFIGFALLLSACSKQKYELGALADKSTLSYTITPSSANPNNIVLTSSTPNLTPVWVTPYGQSLRVKDTVNIHFPGNINLFMGWRVPVDWCRPIHSCNDKYAGRSAVSTPDWD